MIKQIPWLKWWPVLILIAAAVALLFFIPLEKVSSQEGQLILDFGNGQKRVFQGPVDENTSVLLALYSSSEQGGFTVRYFLDDAGNSRVQSIGEAVNEEYGRMWHFFLNDEVIAETELNRTMLKRGDVVEAKFQ
ncbi:MAG: hypothetical protein Q7S32_01500 [bacterium]|nr:hypothetical protein [bacterium]